MIDHIPKVLYKNKIAEVMDDIRYNYGILTRKGYIYGIIAMDQDAKIIAIDSRFDRKLNYWDLSSIGAALYGVARQGQDFFETENLERATIIYSDMRQAGPNAVLTVSTTKEVRLGLIFLDCKRTCEKIAKLI